MSNLLPTESLTLDSLEVAEMMSKKHKNLLRDIETYLQYLESSKLSSQDFFIQSTYLSGQNKMLPCYLVTKKGCELIAHKMIGEKGTQFSAAYIDKFHKLEKGSTLQPLSPTEVLHQITGLMIEQEKKINTIEEQMSDIKETIIHTDQDWRKWINSQISKVAVSWGNETHHHSEARNQSYKILETRARCRLDTRLVNIRNRMAFNGATRSKIDATNNLDVIENVPRLKEIYTTIVKEMALKYTV